MLQVVHVVFHDATTFPTFFTALCVNIARVRTVAPRLLQGLEIQRNMLQSIVYSSDASTVPVCAKQHNHSGDRQHPVQLPPWRTPSVRSVFAGSLAGKNGTVEGPLLLCTALRALCSTTLVV